jgi:hypothetical protein
MGDVTDKERLEALRLTLDEVLKQVREHRADDDVHTRELAERLDRIERKGDERSDTQRRQTGLMETMVETLKAMTLAMNRLSAKLE